MRLFIKFLTLFVFLFNAAVFANTTAQDLMSSANRKVQNATGTVDCLQSKDNCPKAIVDWVSDDKSFGLLPSYEKLGICQTPSSLKEITNTSALVQNAHKVFPQISAQAITPATACSSGDLDLDRKATTKSIYFLARTEQATASNVNQIAAYDAFLGTKGLSQVRCDSPAFVNLAKQCQQLQSCGSATKKQKHISQITEIEKENKLIDQSIEILEKKLPYARVNLGQYVTRNGKDPKVIAERKAAITKIEEQTALLKMLKQSNLQKYPVLTDPEFIDAREDEESVEQALTKAYSKARAEMIEQTNNFVDKSLCAMTIDKKGCSPSALNEALSQTQDIADTTATKELATVWDGMSQQRCIFNNVMDRKGTATKIYKAAGHAAFDIGLTLVPGGAALVLASRAKAAAEIGVNAAKAATRAAQATEKVVATVGVTWLAQSTLGAVDSCQTKFKKQNNPQATNANQCSKVLSAFYAQEFDGAECAKAVLFAAMDGLPVLGQAASYARRSRELSEVLDETKKTADAVAAANKAKAARDQAFKEVQVSNPQQQIWQAQRSGDTAKAQRLESLVQSELTTGRIVSNERVVRAGNVGIGRSGARTIKLESGVEGIWKADVPGDNSTAAEMAAAKIDDHLGADQVPVTIEREVDGVKGTVQLKVSGLKETKTNNPDELKLTDYLNGNSDRPMEGNHLETADGKPVAIDNGRAFIVTDPAKPNYGAVTNPITPRLDEIERIRERISDTEANLKRLSDGTASDAVKKNYSEAELKKELAYYRAEETKKVSDLKKSIEKMIPNDQWVEKLRNTSRADWDKLLGDKLSKQQIDQLVDRQKDILSSLSRADKLVGGISAPPRPMGAQAVPSVSEDFGRAGFRFFEGGTPNKPGVERPMGAETIQSGKSYTVNVVDGKLVLGADYRGPYDTTARTHEILRMNSAKPDQPYPPLIGGAIRVNRDGSIDVAGYNRAHSDPEAEKKIVDAIRQAAPGVKIRSTPGKLTELTPP